MTVENNEAKHDFSLSDWPHVVILACSLFMLGSLFQPDTHLDPMVWMAWFLPFMLVIQGYMLWGFSKL